jgi:hypothetical protein
MTPDPIPTPEEVSETLYAGLLWLLVVVTVGGAFAFANANWDLIAYAVGDFWN